MGPVPEYTTRMNEEGGSGAVIPPPEGSAMSWGGMMGALGERMGSYPLVHDSLTKMAEVYEGAKERSRLVQLAGGMAETGLRVACATARPVAGITVGPVELVSSVGNKSLDSLEKAVPLLTGPTEEVLETVQSKASHLYETTVGSRVANARSAVDGAKLYGEEKVKAARELKEAAVKDLVSYAHTRAERGETVFNSLAERTHLDSLIEYVDGLLEYLLPAPSDLSEEPGQNSPVKPTYPRDPSKVLLAMPGKVGRRVGGRGKQVKADMAASLTEVRQGLAGMTSALDLISLLNKSTSVASEKVRMQLDQAKETLAAYYADAVRRMVDASTTAKGKIEQGSNITLDKRVLFTMRSLAAGVAGQFSELLSTPSLTDSLRSNILAAKAKAESTFAWVDEVTGVSDLSSDALAKMQSNVAFMIQTYGTLVESALESPALSWTGLHKYVPTGAVPGDPKASGARQAQPTVQPSALSPSSGHDYDFEEDDFEDSYDDRNDDDSVKSEEGDTEGKSGSPAQN